MSDVATVAAKVTAVDQKLDLLVKLVADLKATQTSPEQQALLDAADAELATMEAKEDTALQS